MNGVPIVETSVVEVEIYDVPFSFLIGSYARAYSAIDATLIPGMTVKSRGVVFAISDTFETFDPHGFPKKDELYATTIAHELTHLLIEKRVGEFTIGEHTTNPNKNDPAIGPLDRDCIMFDGSWPANREYATVKFYSIVQQELTVRTSEGLVQ